MKTIYLSNSKSTLVDDEDYEKLAAHKWCSQKNRKTFYAIRGIRSDGKRTTIYMHREILNAPDNQEIDHINGDGLDNRRKNLRIVTRRQNLQNRKKEKTSQYPGVRWNKCQKKWTSQININGKQKHLGSYVFELDAFAEYHKVLSSLGLQLPQ